MPGLPATVSWYWVCQSQVMLDTAFMVKLQELVVPLPGTEPVPSQPAQAYWMPEPPDTVAGADVFTVVPALCQEVP